MTRKRAVRTRKVAPTRLEFDKDEPAALVPILARHARGERKTRVLLAGGDTGDRYFLARRFANEIHMGLLELIVSKYIGETEKHLREVLEEAERLDVILYIDEADALFGKRGAARSPKTRPGRQAEHVLRAAERHPWPVVFSARGSPGPTKALERLVDHAVGFGPAGAGSEPDRPRTTQNFRVVVGRHEIGACFVSALASVSEVEDAASSRRARHRFAPVVLRRAMTGARDLFDWRGAIVRGKNDRRDVLIQLLEVPGGRPFASWRLRDAWPVRWSGPVLDGLEPGVATEEIEIEFECLEWV